MVRISTIGRLAVLTTLVVVAPVLAQNKADSDYLRWNAGKIESIARRFRVNGQVGGSFDFRIKSTDRSYNYKLRATWFTPEMIRASARFLQMREHLTDSETVSIVANAEQAGRTIVMVELDPREGSGVIPLDWIALLRAKGSEVALKGTVSPELRDRKVLAGIHPRDYAYDVFWLVFPLADEKGHKLFGDSATEAELVVSIYNKQGKVTWKIPPSLRDESSTGRE